MNKSEIEHNKLIKLVLEEEVLKCPNYDGNHTMNQIYYDDKGQEKGEIDLICMCQKEYCIYEMKNNLTDKNFIKAHHQLEGHNKLINDDKLPGDIKTINNYLAFWSAGDYDKIRMNIK